MAPYLEDNLTNDSATPPLHAEGPDLLELPLEDLPKLYGWPCENHRGYKIREQLFGTERPLRVIHIGAGASGICFAKFAQEKLRNVSVQLYDKNSDVGGTWLENRYPGCACDIPSANYQFTWARNPRWSKFYSPAPEIWQYFKSVTDNHDLNKYIKLNHTVTGASWDEENGIWNVHGVRGDGTEFEDTCNVLVNGTGVLNNWRWPDIQGLHSFEGVLQHSANYDESLKLEGLRVAVLGIGSSGVQIIANIAPIVSKLYAWVRSPTWITAGFAQAYAGKDGANFEYSEEQKERFEKNPKEYLKYTKDIESELNQRFKFILNGTPEAEAAKTFACSEMTKKLSNNAELVKALVPTTFGVGCRRPTPGNGFLEALTLDHTTVFQENVKRVTPKGFIDASGEEHEVDVIICATGFDTSWVPRFPIVAHGKNLQDLWAKDLYSYLAVAVPEMPNFFMANGPYGPLGHGSFLPTLERYANYITNVVQKIQKERIHSLTPKMEPALALKEHADLFLKRTAWSSGCSSWFKQGRVDGPLPMFPGSRIVYFELLSAPRYEDYHIKYLNRLNMFEFLGNGFSTTEANGGDLSFYLGSLDDVP